VDATPDSGPKERARLLRLFLVHGIGWAAVGLVLSFFRDESETLILTVAGAVFGLLFATGIAVFGRTRFVGGFLGGGATLVSALARAFVAYVATGVLLLLLLLAVDALGLLPFETYRPGLVTPILGGVVAACVFVAAVRRRRESTLAS